MNNFQVLAMTDNVTTERAHKVAVIVKNEDLILGSARFYALKENVVYNPYNDFKPENAGGQRLNKDAIDNYQSLQAAAHSMFNSLKVMFETGGNAEIQRLNDIIFQKHHKIVDLEKELEQAKKAPSGGGSAELAQMINNLAQIQINAPKVITVNFGGKSNTVTGKAFHEKLPKIIKLIAKNENIYLHGPAGTGKSELVKQAAEALGMAFYPVSTVTQDFKLTGFLDMKNDYRETQFYKAMKYGGVFFIDEMDSATSEVLVLINAAIANRYFDFPNEFVKAHPDFRVVGAGNTLGGGADNVYTGRFQLDSSTLDRFRFVKIDYSPAIEKAMTNNNNELLAFVWELRNASKNTDIHILVSYRTIGRIVSGEQEEDEELTEILDECLVKGLARDDLKMLVRAMALESKNKYYSALKEIA